MGPDILIDLEEVLANSYCDFHVKGFDYLCLRRLPEETVKVYFFEGDIEAAPEVVIPHDHRYAFSTDVLSGSVANRVWDRTTEARGEAYEEFDYLTPLNGGDGFTWRSTAFLRLSAEHSYLPGAGYVLPPSAIHTIQVLAPQTVLLLRQWEDAVPVGQPTKAFRPAGQRVGPNLDGLYRPMDADTAMARLATYRELTRRAAA